MSKLITVVKKFTTDEDGATMVEYALMVALIAAVCVTAVGALGSKLTDQFTAITGNV